VSARPPQVGIDEQHAALVRLAERQSQVGRRQGLAFGWQRTRHRHRSHAGRLLRLMEGGGKVPVLLDHGRIEILTHHQLVAIGSAELDAALGRRIGENRRRWSGPEVRNDGVRRWRRHGCRRGFIRHVHGFKRRELPHTGRWRRFRGRCTRSCGRFCRAFQSFTKASHEQS